MMGCSADPLGNNVAFCVRPASPPISLPFAEKQLKDLSPTKKSALMFESNTVSLQQREPDLKKQF